MSGPTYISARIATRRQPIWSPTTLRAISVHAEVGQSTVLLRLESAPDSMDSPVTPPPWSVHGHRFMDASTARLLARRLIECADLIEGSL